MVEEARLESVYTPKAYQEFESLTLRKKSERERKAKAKCSRSDFFYIALTLFLTL